MEVVVTGMGFQSCLGSLPETWLNIMAGKSGIRVQKPFAPISSYPLGLINPAPSSLSKLTEQILTACLKDAQLTPPLPDCGVVIGSSRGCQAIWEHLATQSSQQGSPQLIPRWLQTLPQHPATATARLIQSGAPALAPMAACATGIWALARGYDLIQNGTCSRVIAGAVEAPISPLTIAAFERMGALASTGCYPFDRQRQGLVLGEGGAFFMLETADLAQQRQAKIYGQLRGFGLTCDAHHISAPQSLGTSASVAIRQSLARSNLHPSAIDFIHAHGTSTTLNDRCEAQLIHQIFAPQVAVSSTKGATGHTLGGSGAMGVALTLLAFNQNHLPQCVGLKQSEFDLNLVTETQKAHIDHAMCFSFGFGGQNAVVTLSRY